MSSDKYLNLIGDGAPYSFFDDMEFSKGIYQTSLSDSEFTPIGATDHAYVPISMLVDSNFEDEAESNLAPDIPFIDHDYDPGIENIEPDYFVFEDHRNLLPDSNMSDSHSHFDHQKGIVFDNPGSNLIDQSQSLTSIPFSGFCDAGSECIICQPLALTRNSQPQSAHNLQPAIQHAPQGQIGHASWLGSIPEAQLTISPSEDEMSRIADNINCRMKSIGGFGDNYRYVHRFIIVMLVDGDIYHNSFYGAHNNSTYGHLFFELVQFYQPESNTDQSNNKRPHFKFNREQIHLVGKLWAKVKANANCTFSNVVKAIQQKRYCKAIDDSKLKYETTDAFGKELQQYRENYKRSHRLIMG